MSLDQSLFTKHPASLCGQIKTHSSETGTPQIPSNSQRALAITLGTIIHCINVHTPKKDGHQRLTCRKCWQYNLGFSENAINQNITLLKMLIQFTRTLFPRSGFLYNVLISYTLFLSFFHL